MQTPEKLSLIGGSILLASTLVFTLKTSASDILPKVNSGISSLTKSDQERQQDQQKQQDQAFDNDFQQAQQKGNQTGYWGTAKFYVDNQGTMHVGSGELNKSFSTVTNSSKISTISLERGVRAPQDSSWLFSGYDPANEDMENGSNLKSIVGLSNLDTSKVTNMSYMFYYDSNLISNLDLSHFDTSHVTDMNNMFDEASHLPSLDLSNFNTSNVTNMSDMFYDYFNNLNLSSFDTSHVTNMHEMLYLNDTKQLTLGNKSKLSNDSSLAWLNGYSNYQNGNQVLTPNQLEDDNAHPGTWLGITGGF